MNSIDQLVEALRTGSYSPGSLVPGKPLKVESLAVTLEAVTFDEAHFPRLSPRERFLRAGRRALEKLRARKPQKKST